MNVLKIVADLPTLAPIRGQVLVKVEACGVNPVDTYIRSGAYKRLPPLPYTPGKDGAGTVSVLGDGVTTCQVGDRVWFYGSVTGSSAEYCLVTADKLFQLPDTISYEQGACVGTAYLTGYRALYHKGQAKQGETVFVHGASGGVGSAIVQMAVASNMQVYGTAGSEEGLSLLKDMGVKGAYNHKDPSYLDALKQDLPTGPDIIIEMLANKNLNVDLDLISLGGRIVVVGNRGTIEITPRHIMMKECTVTGVMLFNQTLLESNEATSHVNKGLSDGWLAPKVWKTVPLQEISEAHTEIIDNRGAKGQIAVLIGQ